MGYIIIFIGLILAFIVGSFTQSFLGFDYFESCTLGLLVWIVFNQIINYLVIENEN